VTEDFCNDPKCTFTRQGIQHKDHHDSTALTKRFGKLCKCGHHKKEHPIEEKEGGTIGKLFLAEESSIQFRGKCFLCKCEKFSLP